MAELLSFYKTSEEVAAFLDGYAEAASERYLKRDRDCIVFPSEEIRVEKYKTSFRIIRIGVLNV